ncbi:MAG: chemotaxis protein CheW [Candidatus Kapaibacterium sp.]
MSENQDLMELDNDVFTSEDEDTLKDRFLTFKLGEQIYAIAIRYVREIIGIQNITGVPNIRKYIKGIINLRGNIIPVVAVRLRFRMNEIEYDDRTCIVVVQVHNLEIGLIVDEVIEVLNIPENKISQPPTTSKGTQSQFIAGIGKVGKQIKIILDVNKLLYDSLEKHEESEEEEE